MISCKKRFSPSFFHLSFVHLSEKEREREAIKNDGSYTLGCSAKRKWEKEE